MDTLIFALATGPIASWELATMIPPFEPEPGHLSLPRDPAQRAAALNAAETAHRDRFLNHAAADPRTGQILAVAVHRSNDDCSEAVLLTGRESGVLEQFWELTTGAGNKTSPFPQLISYDLLRFTLPFLIHRSWRHGVVVPPGLTRSGFRGEGIVDLGPPNSQWRDARPAASERAGALAGLDGRLKSSVQTAQALGFLDKRLSAATRPPPAVNPGVIAETEPLVA